MTKFKDPDLTADAKKRAKVPFFKFKTLWFNTGTLCNLACSNCYIESSPTNDALEYMSEEIVASYLDQLDNFDRISKDQFKLGFTGGEPFINPEIINILTLCLKKGYKVLVLTNALNILKKHYQSLLVLNNTYPQQLTLRISLDHYSAEIHDHERNHPGALNKTFKSIKWLQQNQFQLSFAGRFLKDETETQAIDGYKELFKTQQIELALTSDNLIIFPEIGQKDIAEIPEITTECWSILNKSPQNIMCASERMVVKRKNQQRPQVLACTLLAYASEFEMGHDLAEATRDPIKLNHRFCSEFCVLGGADCAGN